VRAASTVAEEAAMAFEAIRRQTILVALALVCAATPAIGSPILTGTVTTLPDDSYLYSYELTNPAGESENVFDVALFFDGDPLDVTSPPGWDSIFGLGFIDWMSLDPATDVLAGQTLTGFSFRSVLGPGTIDVDTLGVNAASGEIGEPFRSTVAGPVSSSVPEPGTVGLMGLAFTALVLRRRTARPRHESNCPS
jgi:hypothetical protein